MPYLRHTSAVAAPASCSRRIPMICSSLNLDGRIVRLPFGRRTLPKTGGGLRAQVNTKAVRPFHKFPRVSVSVWTIQHFVVDEALDTHLPNSGNERNLPQQSSVQLGRSFSNSVDTYNIVAKGLLRLPASVLYPMQIGCCVRLPQEQAHGRGQRGWRRHRVSED